MDVQAISKEVEAVFEMVDDLTAEVKLNSGLVCPHGCGHCCNNPAIEVYPVEFLPLALHLHNTGRAELFLAQIAEQQTYLCPLFKPAGSGCCTNYHYRGLICRLMGYSAARNKQGKRKLIACSVFKQEQQEQIVFAEKYLEAAAAPFASQFYDRLTCICPPLDIGILPIKTAIRKAIEYVERQAYYASENIE